MIDNCIYEMLGCLEFIKECQVAWLHTWQNKSESHAETNNIILSANARQFQKIM